MKKITSFMVLCLVCFFLFVTVINAAKPVDFEAGGWQKVTQTLPTFCGGSIDCSTRKCENEPSSFEAEFPIAAFDAIYDFSYDCTFTRNCPTSGGTCDANLWGSLRSGTPFTEPQTLIVTCYRCVYGSYCHTAVEGACTVSFYKQSYGSCENYCTSIRGDGAYGEMEGGECICLKEEVEDEEDGKKECPSQYQCCPAGGTFYKEKACAKGKCKYSGSVYKCLGWCGDDVCSLTEDCKSCKEECGCKSGTKCYSEFKGSTKGMNLFTGCVPCPDTKELLTEYQNNKKRYRILKNYRKWHVGKYQANILRKAIQFPLETIGYINPITSGTDLAAEIVTKVVLKVTSGKPVKKMSDSEIFAAQRKLLAELKDEMHQLSLKNVEIGKKIRDSPC